MGNYQGISQGVKHTQEHINLIGSMRFRKARALLFYLHHFPGLDHRSEKIADIFWQDYPHKKAMASLRQAIRQIRELLPQVTETSLVTVRGHLGLRCQTDRPIDLCIKDMISSHSWPSDTVDTVLRYIQEFDLLVGLSESFDSWLAIKKNQAVQEIANALEQVFEETEDPELAVRAARLANSIEPSNEVAVRFLMRHDWVTNYANRAIETFNALYAYLAAELDQEPEPETIDLVAAIKAGPYVETTDTTRPASPRLRRPRIALAKAETSALAPTDESLLTVLYHDLRMRLSRFREWNVADYNEPAEPDIKITLALLPDNQDGSLAIEVSAPSANKLIWSEIIQAPAKQWDEKARAQLAQISRALSLAVVLEPGASNAAAIYDRWLQSQILIDMWSPETEGRAIEMLSEITIEAPRFGPAHAELAGALNVRHILLPGTRHTEEQKQRALHHALEAINLDPLDTRAHRVLAWCYCHKSEFDLAEFHFEQALELNKSNSLTLASCALGYAFSHRLEEAETLAKRIINAPEALEPFHLVYLAAVNYLCGNFEQALQQCEIAGDLMATVGGWHTASLVQLGRMKDARSRLLEYRRFIEGQWVLDENPTCHEVIDWFASSFPLRNELVREELKSAILAAC